ncbi:MAG: hypothetical protein QGI86_25500 [Candidatus Poribacteria bacterium]|nr:hypothetical protein [Candidatus Poribacteria bacterium]MDP6750664.1 hypothetical protein [Candidatus Poribacteria bacterium]
MRINLFDGLEWNEPDFLFDNDISVSDIREYVVVSDDKLWTSTRNGLVGYDGQKWQLYDPDVSIDWLVKTLDGQLWSESWRQGIVSFDGQKWNLEFNTDNTPLKDAMVNTVLATSNGMILLGTDEGLFQYDPNLNNLFDFVLGKVNVNKILESRDGSIWVCIEDQEQQRRFYRRSNDQWVAHLPKDGISTIYQSDDNVLWAGSSGGLYSLVGRSWQKKISGVVNCIYQLADGTMLIGTDCGLWIQRMSEAADLTTALEGMSILGVFQDSSGVIWSRLDNNILSHDRLSWTNHQRVQNNYLVGYKASMYEGLDGTLWFADWQLDSFKDGTWRTYSPPHGWTRNVTTTSEGRVWAWGGAGASWLSAKDDDWVGAIETNDWVCGFIESPKGRYWLGLWSGVTIYFDGSQWVNVSLEDSGQISFFEDDEGVLWAVGNAISRWQESKKSWLEVDRVDQLGLPQFRTPKRSLDGTWWMMSDEGPIFASFDGKKLLVHPSSGQGNISYRNRQGGGFTEYPAGVFWLASDKGLRRIKGDAWYDLTVADGS